jgi:hypothetical protein
MRSTESQVRRSRPSVEDLVVLRSGLPPVRFAEAFDVGWAADVPPGQRTERTVAAVRRLRGSGLLRVEGPDDPTDLRDELTPLGQLWWDIAADPDVTVEVTAWDSRSVRLGWFAARGAHLVGLSRLQLVEPSVAPGEPPSRTDLDAVEMTIAPAAALLGLAAELRPTTDRSGGAGQPATLPLVDSQAFLLALATGRPDVVDEVVAQANLPEWPVVLRGLADGVGGGLDLTVTSRPGSDTPSRSTGHWILGTEGWLGLQIAMPEPGGTDRSAVAAATDRARVRLSPQRPEDIDAALLAGLTRALEVARV